MQELVCNQPPHLQGPAHAGRIDGKPLQKEVLDRRHQESDKEYRCVDDKQPLDYRSKPRRGKPHLRCTRGLHPIVVLCVVSVVKAHIIALTKAYAASPYGCIPTLLYSIVNFPKCSKEKNPVRMLCIRRWPFSLTKRGFIYTMLL